MHRLPAAFVAAIIALSVGAALAQELPTKTTLTLTEVIDLALRNNIGSIRQEDNVRIAEAQKQSTWRTYLPTATFDAAWQRTSPVQASFINSDLVEFEDAYGFNIRLTQPLFNGFDYIHTPRAAEASLRASDQDLRSTRQGIVLSAKQAAYDLLRAQMLADVQQKAVQRSVEQLQTAQARYDLGSASLSDLLKSKVQLGSDSLTLISRENDIAVKRATLNDFLGLPVDRPTEIDARLEFEPRELPATEAQRAAVDDHPTVRSASYSEAAANSDIGSARSARYPSVDAVAQYSYSKEFFPDHVFEEIGRDDNASYGLQLSYTIFSGFSTTSSIRQAKIRRHTAEYEVAQARRTVALDITTSALRAEEARRRYQLTDEQVRSAQEDLNIAQEKYNLGAATILDILTAQVSLSQAETDKVQAVFDYNLARAQLEKAMGQGD
jgi:outer membrane protein TolC